MRRFLAIYLIVFGDVSGFLWDSDSKNEKSKDSRSINPMLDEFVHGASSFSGLAVDEIIN